MAQPLSFPLFYLAASILCNLAIGIYAWNKPHMRGRRAFCLGIVASCLWMLGSLIARLSSTVDGQYYAEIVRVTGVATLPVWAFAFSRAYCGKPLRRAVLRALLVIPVLTCIAVATTRWTRLYFSTMAAGTPDGGTQGELLMKFGAYFWWVHTPYSFALALLSLLLVANEIGRVPRAFRGKIVYLLIALAIPLLIEVASLTGLWRGYRTAFVLPIFPVMMGIAMFRHDILGQSAVAYESIVQHIRDGVIMLGDDDIIMDINVAALNCVDAPRSAVVGRPLRQVFASWPELLANYHHHHASSCEISHRSEGATRHYLLQISSVLGLNDAVEARTITLCDITDSKNHRDALERMAFCDPLTRLANRRKFQDEVNKLLQLSGRAPQQFAILYFDLNRFKVVNDTLGHEYGDALLQYVALQASETLRLPDFVARLGGDEFVVLLHGATRTDIAHVAARLLECVQQPTAINSHVLLPQLSIGAACYPPDGANLRELLRHADAAMYAAKAQGGGFQLAPA